jgi:hypothetical protein
MQPKPKSALDLIPLIGTDKFREAISWYEAVTPKPWKHDEGTGFGYPAAREWVCNKCNDTKKYPDEHWRNDKKEIVANCPIPDTFTGSLAELAFELEAKSRKLDTWEDALLKVSAFYGRSGYVFWIYSAKPEHWIIAALYALELAGEKT